MKNRSLSICLMLAALLFSGWLYAAVELNDNIPETYIVKKGDTLWGISGMYLKKPWLWPQLWDANPQIDNPHLIYPGDELYLVWIDGQPKLRLRRGRDVKLSPNMRVTPLDLAIPVIPLDQIGPWLRWSRIAGDLRPAHLDEIGGRTIAFDDLPGSFQAYLDGEITGRIVVKISDD